MHALSYVADAAGVISAVLAVRRSRGRVAIWNKPLLRGLAVAVAVVIGCLCYLVIGFALSLLRPAHLAEALVELREGFAPGIKMIAVAALATNTIYQHRWRRPEKPIDLADAGLRERLQRARTDIQHRIEGLQASPVLDYRGGIPRRDLIIEGLDEKLNEIDEALLRLEQGPPSGSVMSELRSQPAIGDQQAPGKQ